MVTPRICKGYSKKWKTFLEVYHKRAIEVWDKWILSDFHSYQDIELARFQNEIKLTALDSFKNSGI